MSRALKIIYSVLVVFIAVIALLLIISVLPINRLFGGQAGNYKVMMVQSGSMAPAIKMGSIVVVKPAPLDSKHLTGQADDYKIGEVITFGPYSKTKAPTTHRIYDIRVVDGQARYITKGDANNAPDQREISKRDILGRVLFSLPYLGFAVDFARKPLGFMLIIIVPAGLIIFDEIKKIYGEIKKKKPEKI